MRILTMKYRVSQEHTDWQQHFWTQEVFVREKCSSSDRTAEITAVPVSSSASAATTGYGCNNSILTLVS
jgi:altronate dehydratase